MKKSFNEYFRQKYKKDPDGVISFVFLFILSPIALFYIFGLIKGTFVFLSLWVVLGAIPYILHYLTSLKFDITDIILLGAIGIYLVWIFCMYLYHGNFESTLFLTSMGMLLYVILRIASWIGSYIK
ncbi:hypothetical protein TSL1_20630 [Sulfurovum sp. TSL1]|nr:hypothetical protein TSL1_20630 [Sulfurovum sp. TSL1]